MKLRNIYFILIVNIISITTIFGISNQPTSKPNEWLEDINYLVERLEIQHPNVYANISEKDFNQAVENLKVKVPTLSDSEIVFSIHEIIAMVQDMHTSIAPWRTQDSIVLQFYDKFPYSFYSFSDGWYIKITSKEHKKILGCRVVKIGDFSIKDAHKRLIQLIEGDNKQGRLATAPYYFSIAKALEYCEIINTSQKTTMTLEDHNGDSFEYELKPISLSDFGQKYMSSKMDNIEDEVVFMSEMSTNPLPRYLTDLNNQYWYEYLPDNKTMYIRIKDMQEKSAGDFERFYHEVLNTFDENEAEKLIIDIRNNGGGDHFEMPLLKGIIARPQLDQSDKLFIITNRINGSASQHFATQFDIYTNATFVGEDTGGRPNHYGAQRFFNLPNSNLPVRTSVAYHQDATDWDQEDCTRPDFYILTSSEDYRNNRDPQVDFIFEYDKYKNYKEEFESQLSEAYLNKGYKGLEKSYYKYMDKWEEIVVNKGKLISDFLWWLSPNKKNRDDYIQFIELWTKECPDWSESWNYLGYFMEKSGKYDLAEKYFNKSLEIFPGNIIAQRRLALLLFNRINNN